MKRAMVMAIKGGKVVVLTDFGEFQTIRLHKSREMPDIGQRMIVPVSYDKSGRFKHWLSMVIGWKAKFARIYRKPKDS